MTVIELIEKLEMLVRGKDQKVVVDVDGDISLDIKRVYCVDDGTVLIETE